MERKQLELALEERDKEAGGMKIILPTIIGTLLGGAIGKMTDPGNPDTIEGIGESMKHKSKMQLTGTLGGLGYGLFRHLGSRSGARQLRRLFGK